MHACSDEGDRIGGRTTTFRTETAMTPSSIIVQFPSGRPLAHASTVLARNRSVAGIVQRLARTRRLPKVGSDEPLAIRLSEFTGVADPTVRQLTALACSGVITPASAGRLALRHADEVTGRFPRSHELAECAAKYALAVVGDPFGQFAFRLHGRSAWIVFAPADSLVFLSELCPRDRIQVCMLVGCDAEKRITVRLLTSTDWRRRLVTLAGGTSRCGCRHILLLGGLPPHEPDRSATLTGIERAVRRGGNTRLLSSSLRKRSDADRPAGDRDPSREILGMIEIVFPGLVDGPVEVGGLAR